MHPALSRPHASLLRPEKLVIFQRLEKRKNKEILGMKKKKYGEEAVHKAVLEPWDNPSPGKDYEIEISFPEFTCVCPRSGYPDFATIRIVYTPDKSVVELKSLKLYLNSFRSRAVSHEAATNEIFDPLKRV